MNNQHLPELERIPVTGCTARYPMLDKDGVQLTVGDMIQYQHCVGRYGQTAICIGIVTQRHYPTGMIGSAVFRFDHASRTLIGSSVHEDPVHGHETWVKVMLEHRNNPDQP